MDSAGGASRESGKNQLTKTQDAWGERTTQDARGIGENQTEGDGDEGIEHLQLDGTVTGEDILVSTMKWNEAELLYIEPPNLNGPDGQKIFDIQLAAPAERDIAK